MFKQLLPVIRRTLLFGQISCNQFSTSSQKCGIYEPDYLEPTRFVLSGHLQGFCCEYNKSPEDVLTRRNALAVTLYSLKPKFPQYNCLNFQMKGYDYPILESYQRWLHGVAEYLDLDVSDCYALAPKQLQVQRFKPASVVIDSEYKLAVYERNMQVSNLAAPMYPFFLRIAQAALPEGVTLEIAEHTEAHEELRYVPDKNLLELKAQLDSMTSAHPQKKK